MRLCYTSAAFLVFAIAGCGGGNSNTPVPPIVPTAAPTATAVASATPAPTPTPASSAAPASFQYAGSMTQTIRTTYNNPAPQPTGTPIVSGTVTSSWSSRQTLTVTPTSGPPGTFDLHVVDTETGASPSPVTAAETTTDTIVTVAAGGTSNTVASLVTSVSGTPGDAAAFDDRVVTAYNPPRIVDVLPETAGANWTNTDAQVSTETAPGGNVTTRTVLTNNTYTQTTIQPPLSPSPAPTLFAFTENADGSGSFNTVNSGTTLNTYAFTFSTPPIRITYEINGGTALVAASPSTWWASPLTLYAETDVATTGVAIPATCNVPASFGTTARQVTQNWTRVDTIYGTIETQAVNQYSIPGLGVACQTISDTLQLYYDYTSGNYSASAAYAGAPLFYNGTAAWKTVTTAQTLGLVSASVTPSAIRARSSLGPSPAARPATVAVERAVRQLRHDQRSGMIESLTRGAAK